MRSTIPKRRGGDTVHPCARTPPGTPRRDPTRFPSLVAPALSEGREKRLVGRKSAGWLCIRDLDLEKYAAKTSDGEIVALGAYREDQNGISIFIVDIEAHPESNPTISKPKKYLGIGRMMIAFGIQLSIDADFGGIVTFAAKTDELLEHYINDFGEVPITQPTPGGPKLLMVADESAQEIFGTYLS
ncbi:MAG: hypothetical protein PUE97_11400 [Subdoligranulum variabile]|nr:hypothetical protein [Subdoligranulum variabile]